MSIVEQGFKTFLRSFIFNLKMKGYENYSVRFHDDFIPVNSLNNISDEDKKEFIIFIISRYSSKSSAPSFKGIELSSETEGMEKIDLVLNYTNTDMDIYYKLFDYVMINESVKGHLKKAPLALFLFIVSKNSVQKILFFLIIISFNNFFYLFFLYFSLFLYFYSIFFRFNNMLNSIYIIIFFIFSHNNFIKK